MSRYKNRATHFLRFGEYSDDIPFNQADDVFGTVIYLKVPDSEQIIESSQEITRIIRQALNVKVRELISRDPEKAREVSEVLEDSETIDEFMEKFKTVVVAYVLSTMDGKGVDTVIDLKSSALDLMEATETLFLKSVPYLDEVQSIGRLLDNMRFSVESLKVKVNSLVV
ncbi:hypothetical protein GWK48_00725 [Metallosphaera tengchongensis]|uniref:Uncharacterized protein n=2 Tax=Metallosphaera tengchongensis TaxID=1532350 RepID=A0A6N0NXH4_9CREN|nr:hypothetical protein GWK48_00725 [Metallosphaera tengchongensis]